ncbi:hypothetical protein ACH5RR_033953 [Cinchona calisaya]|uniref:Uncharacterized protein n=1 Tax=Cinchona calisaya TaxID=153742 RepID=A0ABD2YCG0_9GENT
MIAIAATIAGSLGFTNHRRQDGTGHSGSSWLFWKDAALDVDIVSCTLKLSTPFCPPGPVNALGIYPTENVLFLIIFKARKGFFVTLQGPGYRVIADALGIPQLSQQNSGQSRMACRLLGIGAIDTWSSQWIRNLYCNFLQTLLPSPSISLALILDIGPYSAGRGLFGLGMLTVCLVAFTFRFARVAHPKTYRNFCTSSIRVSSSLLSVQTTSV